MPVERHPSQELRAAYRAGDTSPGTALALTVHAEKCSVCGVDIQHFPSSSRGHRANDARGPVDARSAAVVPVGGVESHALTELRQWPWRWLAPGVRAAELHGASGLGEAVHLVKLGPGRALPAKRLGAVAQVVVLGGALRRSGERYEAGDYLDAETQPLRRLAAERPDGCLCLVITDGAGPGPGLSGLLPPFRGEGA